MQLIDERWTLKLGDPEKREMSTIVRRDDKSFVVGYAMREWANPAGQAEDDMRAKAMTAAPEMLAALLYVADLTQTALTKEQAETLRKRCQAAIALVAGPREKVPTRKTAR